jgi:hypothetical protein
MGPKSGAEVLVILVLAKDIACLNIAQRLAFSSLR